MELLLLRAALRGLSAYRTMLEQPLLNTALTLVDSLCTGEGEKALEAYTALFYALRAAGQPSLGRWLEETLRYAEGPIPCWRSGAAMTRSWNGRPVRTWRLWPRWRSWTAGTAWHG